jgi:hypothetical protein
MIKIELETGKNVELDNFYVSGSYSVGFSLKFVELDITTIYCLDVSDFADWKDAYPMKSVKDYVKMKLLSLYDAYRLAFEARKQMEKM